MPPSCALLLAAVLLGAVLGCERQDADYRESVPPQSPTGEPKTTSAKPPLPNDGGDDWNTLADAWEYPDPIPNFELMDQDGKRFHLAELSESYVLVGFVFTHCSIPAACPLTMAKMQQVQQLWAKQKKDGKTRGRKLHLLTLTFDPENDTPEVFKAYGEARRIDFSTWILATGPTALMEDALPSLFGVLALPNGRGSIAHSVKIALLAPGLESVREWDDNKLEPEDVVRLVLSHGAD